MKRVGKTDGFEDFVEVLDFELEESWQGSWIKITIIDIFLNIMVDSGAVQFHAMFHTETL